MMKLPPLSTEASAHDAYRRTLVEFGALLVLGTPLCPGTHWIHLLPMTSNFWLEPALPTFCSFVWKTPSSALWLLCYATAGTTTTTIAKRAANNIDFFSVPPLDSSAPSADYSSRNLDKGN